jgi:hypothetical protein
MKKPFSHVCAVFVYVALIMVNVMMWLQGRLDTVTGILGLLCVAQLLGAFVSPRDRRQYWVGSVLLWIIAMGALYDTVVAPGSQLLNHTPGVRATWTVVIVNALAVAVFFRLPFAYAFGDPSRNFYGFPPRKRR